ncbi:MAG: NAD(P)/FAD-dependent oxidoreductase [Myxococcota bacterium]
MSSERVKVVIVGSGFAGICMAIKLRELGITDFVILERADALGGTWRDNHYPGCACDVPSYLYSYSFAPSTDWSRMYAESAEIRAYLERVAADFEVKPHLRFQAELSQARWDEGSARWEVQTSDGRAWSAEHLVLGMGGLSRPALPNIPGREDFQGPSFHSAAWRHDVVLTDRRVGVIGTGASAIQFVPHVAEAAGRTYVFQRSAPWIMPKRDRPFTPREQRMLKRIPGAATMYRGWIYGSQEIKALGFANGSRMMQLGERLALKHLHEQVKDPGLREKLTPNYRMGCKRVLLSNDYYPAMTRPDLELVTTGIRRITEDGVELIDGTRQQLDVLIYGTGFLVHEYVGRADIRGIGGQSLADLWKKGAEAYLGTTVAGFPNLFVLVGPNTGLGHNSIVFMIESQVRYVVGALEHMRDHGLRTVAVRPEVQAGFNAQLVDRLEDTVWASGCQSWYRDENGRNSTLWPGFTFEFRARTLSFDPESYTAS